MITALFKALTLPQFPSSAAQVIAEDANAPQHEKDDQKKEVHNFRSPRSVLVSKEEKSRSGGDSTLIGEKRATSEAGSTSTSNAESFCSVSQERGRLSPDGVQWDCPESPEVDAVPSRTRVSPAKGGAPAKETGVAAGGDPGAQHSPMRSQNSPTRRRPLRLTAAMSSDDPHILHSAIEHENLEKEGLLQELNNLQQDLEALRQDFATSEDMLRELRRATKPLAEENAALEVANAEAVRELQHLRQRREEDDAFASHIKEEEKDAQDRLNDAQAENQQLKIQLDDLQRPTHSGASPKRRRTTMLRGGPRASGARPWSRLFPTAARKSAERLERI